MSHDRTGQVWWMNSGGNRFKLLLVVEPAYDGTPMLSSDTVFHHPALVVFDEVRPDLEGTVGAAVESDRMWEQNPAMRRVL